ncbi:MAG: UDP-N-acetylmuramoyl-L-alanine--D-glutamate ligase, partial [Planctomycetes bacterium]|nr:UDP-N-acetylmuramoyl-L-alanine--D-glutamate ligase [Planctomycetota bacterium]
SNGKSSTASLAAALLEAGGARVHFGGNIGKSLLMDLKDIRPGDRVVLELSSFQLEALGPLERGVEVAVVTNLSANHLDRHGTLENYAAAKRGLLARLGTRGVAVLNADDPRVAGWAADVPGRSRLFSLGPVSGASGRLQDGALWVDGERLMGEGELAVPGRFNRANALAAALAARAAGVSLEPIREALRAFRGVEHRLELVAERGGVRYVNDSKATTPQATAAALASLEGPVLLLAGGRYKEGVPVAPLVEAARSAGPRLRRVLCFGEAARALEAALAVVEGVQAAVAAGMDGAVETAMAEARPGETVLLSPGCASYDEFTNFEERGRRFKDLVGGVAPRGGGV